MKTVSIKNITRQAMLCQNCYIANNPFTRMRGLLGRKSLHKGEGLLIVPCSSIHMFGMKFPLDIVFLTRENLVTDYIENILPGKYFVAQKHYGKAHAALEITAGTIMESNLQRGDQLEVLIGGE